MSARLRPALEFTEDHQPVINMMDDAGFDAIEANKTKPAHDLGGRK